ncbi:Nuclear transcription factor Y subunit A-1-like protein [Drosera capensis]
MPSKSSAANQAKPDSAVVPHSAEWWQGAGYDPIASANRGGNATDSSSLNGIGGSKDGESASIGGLNGQDDDGSRDSGSSSFPHREGDSAEDGVRSHHGGVSVPFGNGECLAQPPQMELVRHSIACETNPYPDMYYGGMMAAFGPQQFVPPQFYGMHPRMPLPLEMTPEPVYVNAKQYRGILRRRQSRAKAELEKKLIKERKPYLHESRHQHALRRQRGSGGRFAKKKDKDDSNHPPEANGRTSGGSQLQETPEARQGDNTHYQNHSSFQQSMYYQPHQRQNGDQSNQQWGSNASTNGQDSQRAVAINNSNH